MGKSTKDKKQLTKNKIENSDNEITEDDDKGMIDEDGEASSTIEQQNKSKKGKKKSTNNKNKPNEEEEEDDEIEVLGKNINQNLKITTDKNKKKNKKKSNKNDEDDDGGVDEDAPVSSTKGGKKKSGFELLMEDDDDGDDDDDDVGGGDDNNTKNVEDNKKQKAHKQKSIDDSEETTTTTTAVSAAGGKKGKKSKKKRNESEEDIDKVLAELQIEYSGGKKADVNTNNESKTNNESTTKQKKNKQKNNEKQIEMENTEDTVPASDDIDLDQNENETGEDGGGTVKTAAQKKKEKKERQKREAALLKQQQQQQQQQQQAQPPSATSANDASESQVNANVEIPDVVSKKETKVKKGKEPAKSDERETAKKEDTTDVETGTAEGEIEGEGGEPKDGDKKKKKKGKIEKKPEEEKEKPGKKKGVNQAMLAVMQERLQKLKEEEERLKFEEEERIRKEEEVEQYRLEQIRLEAERKEKKKQRDLERKARLKAEGKLLTAKEKQNRARAQAFLESIGPLPEVVEKRPRPGTRIRPNRKQKDGSENAAADAGDGTTITQTQTKTDDNKQPGDTDKVKTEEIKEEIIKDEWDASSSEDESQQGGKTATTTGDNVSGSDDDSDMDSSDNDEDDDDDVDDANDDGGDNSEEKVKATKKSTSDTNNTAVAVATAASDAGDEDTHADAENKKEKAWERIQKRRTLAQQKCSPDVLRAAVVCVLGHVDTGKTKILDKLRRTNVQDGEAGGITQQIGATNVPIENIKEQTKIVKGYADMQFKLPGLLIIDTPGHESFSNLRSRGSSLCDIAILVVDIMHGLEPQTLESISLLKSKKTPFVVALNKIDRLYDWKTFNRKDIRDVLKGQAANTLLEFNKRTQEVILQFAEQGLNAALFHENPDPRTYVSLIPTSAITGEGMGNLLYLIIESCQSWLSNRLMYSEELQATVLEVKAIPGLGTTIDAILINGKLREGDTMVIAGTDGPIVTQIRSLLMPQPMKELRVKNAYIEYKEIIAAQGVKIAAKELEKAIAGLNLYIAQRPDEVDICTEQVSKELKSALSHIKLSAEGVYVQASTLGSLEALLEFLKSSKIPYCNIRIGPVVKRDVMKASTMLEHEAQYATILAFDVKIEKDAQQMADTLGVKIFQADIIYHLFDKFTAYRDELKQRKRDEFKSIAIFPCKLRILPQFIFNSRDPIVIGVMVEGGIVKEGTPICVPSKGFLDIGVIASIEANYKRVDTARKGQEICIRIDPIPGESPKMYGRHFEETDMLVSKISRISIDACKDHFRDDLVKTDWALIVELKKLFQIL